MNRKRTYAQMNPDDQGGYDVLMADDPDNSFYGLVLAIDDAVGVGVNDHQFHLTIDAATVAWYRALNLLAIPPLNGTAVASGCRIFEAVMLHAEFNFLDNFLQLTTNHALEESTWWMITPGVYNLRGSVRIEEFLPVNADVNPASLAERNSRHRTAYVLRRLIVPRRLLAQRLFSLREFF